MTDAQLARRIEMLEETLKSLRQLPDDVKGLTRRMTGVEVQILQLRTEMRDEFSAVRSEMATKRDLDDGLAALRSEMVTKKDLADALGEFRKDLKTHELAELREDLKTHELAELRADLKNNELADLKRELREDIAGMGRDLATIVLQTQKQVVELGSQVLESRDQTRMMFEEIVSRLKVLDEGHSGPAA